MYTLPLFTCSFELYDLMGGKKIVGGGEERKHTFRVVFFCISKLYVQKS